MSLLCNSKPNLGITGVGCTPDPAGIKKAWLINLYPFYISDNTNYYWEYTSDTFEFNVAIELGGDLQDEDIKKKFINDYVSEIKFKQDTAQATSIRTNVGKNSAYWTHTFTCQFESSDYANSIKTISDNTLWAVCYETYEGTQYIMLPNNTQDNQGDNFEAGKIFKGMRITQWDHNTGANPASDEATFTFTVEGISTIPATKLSENYF